MPTHVRTGGATGGAAGLAGRLAGRLLRALALSLVLVAAAALPASAHAVGGATPTNYQTRILSVTPQSPGVTVRVVEAGARLELINTSGQDVIVTGYDNEPYLRVGPNGVEENTRSPATYLNRSTDASTKPPADADSKAEPAWRKVADGNRIAWHDHRAHWMGTDPPPQVQQNPGQEHVINQEWRIDLQRGGQTIAVAGDLRWVPGPSSSPWLVGAALLALVLLLASRTPAWVPFLAASLVLLVVADVVHTAAVWSGLSGSVSVKLYGSIVPLAGWLVAVVALLRLRAGQRESGIFFALFAAALALVSVIGDLSGLSSSQLIGTFPDWVTRTTIAARLGLAAGIAIAGLIAMRRSAMPARGAPDTGRAAAGVLLAAVLAGGLLLAAAPPASAHGRQVLVRVELSRVDGRPGSVRVVAVTTFLDGHRAGGLTVRGVATGGGTRVAFPLRTAGQRGTYAATVALGPGAWTIRVTASGRATGQGTARITIPSTARASTTTVAPTTTTATTLPPETSEPPAISDITDTFDPATSEPETSALAADPAGERDGGGPAAAIVAALAIGGLAALATGAILMRRTRRS